MCGIAGIISNKRDSAEFPEILAKANAEIIHRGPDSEGYHLQGNLGFSMRRLSIIDLSGGSQPLYNEDRTLALVCNGEIYNYIELRRELEAKGAKFQTHSDCETILHLYAQEGVQGFQRLRGMFAFALHDVKNNQAILCRDRLGERPMFIYRTDGELLFASELKALLPSLPKGRLTLSARSAFQFLTFQYVHEPYTLFNEIEKLPAGHFAVVDLAKPAIHPQPYWAYLDAPAKPGNPKVVIRERLEEAVEIMLRSDVPVGLSLSGGIDSSLIAALVRQKSNANIQAFSVGYPGRPENDERSNAEKLAKKLDIEFNDVELSGQDFIATLPRLMWDMDEPIGDIAAFGYWSVNKLAHQKNIRVLLSGLGADEVFWGYQWVREACIRMRAKIEKGDSLWSKLMGRTTEEPSFFQGLGWVKSSAAQVASILAAPLRETSGLNMDSWRDCERDPNREHVVLWALDLHNKTWLTSNCLALSDRMGLAHSVETRLPFLDHVMIDAMTSLRKNGLRDESMGHKTLLIQACEDLLPREIFDRPKRGFTPPTGVWMQEAQKKFGVLFEDSSLVRHGILDPSCSRYLTNDEHTGLGFRLILLEIWMRLYVDRISHQELAELSPRRFISAAASI